MNHDADIDPVDKKQPSRFSFFYRSLAFCFIINVLIGIVLVYTHSSHLSVPLITSSPCDLSDEFLAHYDFTSDRVVLHDSDTTETSSCAYTRRSLSLGARVVNDNVNIRVYRIAYEMPKKFTQFGPGRYTDQLDRRVSLGHEIRVYCETEPQCSVYIYPNVIMEFNYPSGDSPRSDALRWARAFVGEKITHY